MSSKFSKIGFTWFLNHFLNLILAKTALDPATLSEPEIGWLLQKLEAA